MKSSIYSLVFTVFLLWLTIQMDLSHEVYLAYFFVLTVGILHGANDISLINYVFKEGERSKNKYLAFYLLIIVLTSLTFFMLPILALIIFIGFSCYHFGEQHFNNQFENSNVLIQGLYVSYGILIFGLLFYFNASDTTSIILELTDVSISEPYYLYFLVVGGCLSFAFGYLNLQYFKRKPDYFQEVFLILLFALIFKLASLLWGFAIYFIIWHSIPSLIDQITVLYGELNKNSLLKYTKASLINWLISVLGLALVYYMSSFFNIRFITLFFAFLAAITIPHVIVMYYLNKK